MNEVEISDMYLAAALLAYGANLEEIDRSNTRRLQFRFSVEIDEIWSMEGHSVLKVKDPTFEVIENKFIGDKLMYPPNFIDCIKKVKSAIHGV